MGLPFIDKPVNVDTLASAVVEALLDAEVRGVQDWRKMEQLSERLKSDGGKRAAVAGRALGGGGSDRLERGEL